MKADSSHAYTDRKDMRSFYSAREAVYDPVADYIRSLNPVKTSVSKSGQTLAATEKFVHLPWHFTVVLLLL